MKNIKTNRLDCNSLIKDYNLNMRPMDICKKYNISNPTMRKILRSYGAYKEKKHISDDEIINRCQQAITLSPPFELVVNITGGTTALQYIANKFYRSFRGRKRLVALVDERSVEEQRSDPFQLGEVITVEDCC